MAVININSINKSYKDNKVLKDISVKFEANKIYGLLGRNGAGKTTLLNILTDRIFADSGVVTIDGENVIENENALSKINFIEEKTLYPEDYKVKDVMKWTKEFYKSFDIDYAMKLAEKFELDINKKIKNLSTGYVSICKIIMALSSNTEIVIYDEPVLGLDAGHRELFYKELMTNYIAKPKTIILSTHIIEEVSNLLEDVVILNKGRIISTKEKDDFLNSAYTVSGSAENVDEFIKSKKVINIDDLAGFKAATVLEAVTDEDKKNASKLELKFSKVDLQQLFIYLTDKGGNSNE